MAMGIRYIQSWLHAYTCNHLAHMQLLPVTKAALAIMMQKLLCYTIMLCLKLIVLPLPWTYLIESDSALVEDLVS